MDALKRTMTIMNMISRVKTGDGWCGQSHIQAFLFFLQELCAVPLSYDFFIYKHALHSFDLSDDLTEMRADGLLESSVQGYPTEPKLTITGSGKRFMERYHNCIEEFEPVVNFLSVEFEHKSLSELECTALGLHFSSADHQSEKGAIAEKLATVRPGIGIEEARLIVEKVERIVHESRQIPVRA